MHRDLILLALAAAFGLGATVAAMAAPSRFPDMPAWVWHWLLWGGIILMAAIVVDGIWLWLGRPSLRTAVLANVGICFLALSFVSLFDDGSAKVISTPPPIGTVRYVSSKLLITHIRQSDQWEGRVQVTLSNDSNRLVFFHAITAGNINGVPFDRNKINFDGYINAHQETLILSKRIAFNINPDRDINHPWINAIFEYELRYRYAVDNKFVRRTARGLAMSVWHPAENMQLGEKRETESATSFYSEIEE